MNAIDVFLPPRRIFSSRHTIQECNSWCAISICGCCCCFRRCAIRNESINGMFSHLRNDIVWRDVYIDSDNNCGYYRNRTPRTGEMRGPRSTRFFVIVFQICCEFSDVSYRHAVSLESPHVCLSIGSRLWRVSRPNDAIQRHFRIASIRCTNFLPKTASSHQIQVEMSSTVFFRFTIIHLVVPRRPRQPVQCHSRSHCTQSLIDPWRCGDDCLRKWKEIGPEIEREIHFRMECVVVVVVVIVAHLLLNCNNNDPRLSAKCSVSGTVRLLSVRW